MFRFRLALVLLLVAIAVAGASIATLQALRPAGSTAAVPLRAPNAVPSPARLTRHLLFVVVDGLRWDIATDPNTMPKFSEAMRRHTSGEVWADPISMTSSAVLAYGTGQRASLDQVLENLRPPRPRVNSWLQNAHAAGLTLMGVGDPIWFQLYGRYLAAFHADPVNAAVERDFNAQTFAAARRMQSMAPDFLVVHFVTPDHQGHAYGIRSERYHASMRDFDRDLFEWLDPITPEWTVLVTSDHGATDSGTHGSDTTTQRRSPFFAYGPGIHAEVTARRALDQVELTGLFAALLGVPNAEQSRGLAPYEWLAVSTQQHHRRQCSEAERLRRQVVSLGVRDAATENCPLQGGQRDCLCEARVLAANYDGTLGRNQGIQSRGAWPWIGVALGALLAVTALVWGKRALATAVSLGVWFCCSLALTLYVERLPGTLPNAIRGILFALTNGVLLLGALNARRLAGWFGRHTALALGVFPGWLLVSYSTNTQVEAYCVLVVLSALLVTRVMDFSRAAVRPRSPTFSLTRSEKTVLAISLATLALAGTRPDNVRLPQFIHHPQAETAVAGLVLLLGLLWSLAIVRRQSRGRQKPTTDLARAESARGSAGHLSPAQLGAAALVLLSFALQRLPMHWIGRASWLATAIGAALCAFRQRRIVAFYLGVASYAWLSRNFEWFIFVAALVLAELVGRTSAAAASHNRRASESNPISSDRPTLHRVSERGVIASAVHVTFLFGLGTLLYIGLQGGLQLQNLDLTAGTFGSPVIPVWLAGAFLVYKFVIAETLLVIVFLRGFEAQARARLVIGLGVAHLVRGICLVLMLFVCGNSYWTAFRVVSDLPFAWLGLVGIVVAVASETRGARRFLPLAFTRQAAPGRGLLTR